MSSAIMDLLKSIPFYGTLSEEDVAHLAEIALVRHWQKGEALFCEGDPSDHIFAIASGRVKVVKALPSGKEVILEIFGPGDPVGAVVAYEGRPYPATAFATEPTVCVLVRRAPFLTLLESRPSLLRGFLVGLTQRIVEFARRIPEVAGGRVEARLAHLFLKLADRMGKVSGRETFIPMPLSRQDLADLAGTTLETAIRIMSRWSKERTLLTEREGFRLLDREALDEIVSR
jgi:CRP/FNR family transcriptional regulator